VAEGYIDESALGRYSDQTRLYVVAGWVGTADAWRVLEAKWQKRIRATRPRISEFKAADCAQQRGEFASYSQRKATRLSLRLGEIIAETDIRGAATIMLMLGRLKQPYYDWKNAFNGCFLDLAVLADGYPKGERVAYMIDEKDKVENHVRAVAELFKTTRQNRKIARRIGPWGFYDSKEFMPIQAADYLAYEVLQDARRLLTPELCPPLTVDRAQFRLIRSHIKTLRLMIWDGAHLYMEYKNRLVSVAKLLALRARRGRL
jgi:uncharacterized protein DUF3800